MSIKVPAANKGVASICLAHYGEEDSKYMTLAQETLKLKKAMHCYDFNVLLKHNTVPSWLDLSEKDEKLADIKDLPTKANLFKYIIELTDAGYVIDVSTFVHGWTGRFKVSTGKFDQADYVTAADIANELHPNKTGFTHIPIRMKVSFACNQQSLGEVWRSIGAKTTGGARRVQFYPHRGNKFFDDWNKGNVSFRSAIMNSDTDAIRTQSQLYISMIHAPSHNKEWGRCPVGKTVLGDSSCAKDYFEKMWSADGEWQNGMSGKEYMNWASYMFCGGDKDITKNTIPRGNELASRTRCLARSSALHIGP